MDINDFQLLSMSCLVHIVPTEANLNWKDLTVLLSVNA
jgi:hypothetical protein